MIRRTAGGNVIDCHGELEIDRLLSSMQEKDRQHQAEHFRDVLCANDESKCTMIVRQHSLGRS